MIQAVVFDMDGVLFDTERISTECCFQAAKELGLSLSHEAVYGCFGLNGADTKAHMIWAMEKEYPNGSFPHDRFSDKYRECFQARLDQEIPVMPGVRELLAFLREKGIRIAIASSSRQERVRANLERNGLTAYFDAVISGDMVEHSKPLPDIYQKACQALGVSCGEAMAVEDSPNGVRSARAAGMISVMVPDLVQPGPELDGLYDLKFDSLFGLKDYLAEALGR